MPLRPCQDAKARRTQAQRLQVSAPALLGPAARASGLFTPPLPGPGWVPWLWGPWPPLMVPTPIMWGYRSTGSQISGPTRWPGKLTPLRRPAGARSKGDLSPGTHSLNAGHQQRAHLSALLVPGGIRGAPCPPSNGWLIHKGVKGVAACPHQRLPQPALACGSSPVQTRGR